MNTDVVHIASAFIQRIKQSGIIVEQAYLFGSHARGKANAYSDIDICVVSPMFGKDPIAEMVSLRHLAYPLDPRIEPITLHPHDMNDRYSTIVSEIKKHGIPLSA